MEINLLPWRDEQIEYYKNQFMRHLLIALIVSVVMLFLISNIFFSDVSYAKKYNATLSRANTTLTQGIAGYLNEKKSHESLNTRLLTLQQLQAKRFEMVKLLNLITQATPAGIYLTKMVRTQDVVEIFGDTNSNFLISQFIKSLDASSLLQVTKLQKVEKKENAGLIVTHFDLKLTLKSA